MKPKKNPNADLKKRTGLFFSIGLAVATFASLYAINYKTSEEPGKRLDEKEVFDIPEDVTDFRLEDNSPPPQQEPEPPKEVEDPDVIKEVDNKEKVNTDLKPQESSQEDNANKGPNLNSTGTGTGTGTGGGEEEIPDEVPFNVLEEKPMFPQCKDVPKPEQENCFKKALDAHVRKTLEYPQPAIDMGLQGRIIVQFRIKKDGNVEVTNVQGKEKILEKEARRVIEKLPKLIPGKQRDRPVAVIYSYPIVFRLN